MELDYVVRDGKVLLILQMNKKIEIEQKSDKTIVKKENLEIYYDGVKEHLLNKQYENEEEMKK